MMFFFKVKGEGFTLTTPYDDAHLSEINIGQDDSLIIKMDHVLAFTASTFLEKKWRLDLVSLLTLQFRYVYIPGPARIIYFGLGDIEQETFEGQTRDYDRGAIIGWTNTLAQGVSSRSSLASALLGKEQVCLDRFVGSGTLITQASTVRKLPKQFHDEQTGNSLLDYLNAILGIRI